MQTATNMLTDNVNVNNDIYPFTPGPWTAINSFVYSGTTNIANCSLEHLKIAARFEYYSGDKQTEQDRDNYLNGRHLLDNQELANAQLIAAAPDLLEAALLASDALFNANADARPAILALDRAIKKVYGNRK